LPATNAFARRSSRRSKQQIDALYPSPATTPTADTIEEEDDEKTDESSPKHFLFCRQKPPRFSVGLFAVYLLVINPVSYSSVDSSESSDSCSVALPTSLSSPPTDDEAASTKDIALLDSKAASTKEVPLMSAVTACLVAWMLGRWRALRL
jgi:hypothetical protein